MTELGQITISVNGSHDGGAGAEVSVAGDVDLETAPRLSDVLAEAIGSRSGDLTVDLAGVEFIDAAGIGVLVSAANQVRTSGARLVVRSPSPAVRRVLDAGELDGVLPHRGMSCRSGGPRRNCCLPGARPPAPLAEGPQPEPDPLAR